MVRYEKTPPCADTLDQLYRSGRLTETDLHFSRFMGELSQGGHPDLLLAAALVSHATGQGDVCLALKEVAGTVLLDLPEEEIRVIGPSLKSWRKQLLKSGVVAEPGTVAPLVLDPKNRLYLYRYWEYEKQLSHWIKDRVENDFRLTETTQLKSILEKLIPDMATGEDDEQLAALIIAALKRICVISGGPGTGKTTTVAAILAFLFQLSGGKDLSVLLSAPTGKAAARLAEAIRAAKERLHCADPVKALIPENAFTLHRMLKSVTGSPYFRHNAENPLPADVVVVDEASMVDLALMAKLTAALAPHTRLILIGDKDQLASVAAGAVLGDICGRDHFPGFSPGFCRLFERITGRPSKRAGTVRVSDNHRSRLRDSIVVLKRSFRFAEGSGIGDLSRAVNAGESDTVFNLLKTESFQNIRWAELPSREKLPEQLYPAVIEGYADCLRTDDPLEALERLDRFKILCAVKKGPYGVNNINSTVEQLLRAAGLVPGRGAGSFPWYKGRPVLITRNDYNLGLFNGDIGVAMPDPESAGGDLYVFFPGSSDARGTLRRFLPHRLSAHETVYATTVHKSQGSEFDRILLILPESDSPVLTRELLYTGVTRARHQITVWARTAVLRTTVSRRLRRRSGLRDALWDSSPVPRLQYSFGFETDQK